MKLGLHIPETSWRGGAPGLRAKLHDVVQAGEAAGFDTIAVADHVWLHPIMGGPLQSHVEAYTTLGFIAAHTERVRLLAMATAASYRPAGLLAKIVATLDVLSGGRAMLGIGSGDYEEEAAGLGLPFPRSGPGRPGLVDAVPAGIPERVERSDQLEDRRDGEPRPQEVVAAEVVPNHGFRLGRIHCGRGSRAVSSPRRPREEPTLGPLRSSPSIRLA
jgi:hypothetical protein